MKKILLSILFCLFAIPAFATQYYINYGVGNDTNNGTSTGTPFNTCTPIEGTNFLKPGDIVSIFYTNDFINTDAHCNIASAGSASSHITFNTYGGTPAATGLTITTTVSSGAITGGSIAVAGTGYTAGQIVNVMNSTTSTYGHNAWTGGQFTVSTVSAGVPQTITLLNGGYNYTATTGATTSAPQPVFDQSVNITSAAGWTGWSLYETGYVFTITSATVSAGCVYTNNAQTFTTIKAISSNTGIVTTGTGAPAGSGTLTYSSGSGTCPNLTFSASYSSPIYVSQTTIPFAVANVAVDQSYSLRRMDTSQQNVETMITEHNSYFQSSSGNLIYVQLDDASSPASHNIQVGGEYFNTAFKGVFSLDSTYSKYIDVYNITAQGGFNYGYLSGAPYSTCTNCIGQFNGREGAYLQMYAVPNGVGAAYNVLTNFLSQYNNGYFTTSAGQGITIEAPHVDIINSISQFNWQAGIDALTYPPGILSPAANPVYDRIINTFEHDNGYRAWSKSATQYPDPDGYDPACIYTDVASNFQAINNVCLVDGVLNSTTTANAINAIHFGDEHTSTYTSLSNFDLINSLTIGGNFTQVEASGTIDGGSCTGTECNVIGNVRLIGDTFSGGTYSFSLSGILASSTVTMYNNIFSKNAGSRFGITPGYVSNVATSWTAIMNNNLYYNPSASGGASNIFDQTFQGTAVSFSSWKSLSGNDSAGQNANPLLTTGTAPGYIPNGFFLTASTSPALAAAIPNILGNQYVFSSIGTVLASLAVDNPSAPADGYHYYATLSSSSFPSSQVGSDIGGSVY